MSLSISVSKVSYSVEEKNILKNITFQLEKGDNLGLLGENGSGKSTLIDIILNDIKPQKGTINILGNNKPDFKKIGIVYDNLPLFPHMKIKEIINYFSIIHKVSYKRLSNIFFEVFKIKEIKNSYINQLSQGEKKRVSILLSLIHKPELIILGDLCTKVKIFLI